MMVWGGCCGIMRMSDFRMAELGGRFVFWRGKGMVMGLGMKDCVVSVQRGK